MFVWVQNCGCLSLPGSPSSGRYHAAATDRADRESANLQSTLLERKKYTKQKKEKCLHRPLLKAFHLYFLRDIGCLYFGDCWHQVVEAGTLAAALTFPPQTWKF